MVGRSVKQTGTIREALDIEAEECTPSTRRVANKSRKVAIATTSNHLVKLISSQQDEVRGQSNAAYVLSTRTSSSPCLLLKIKAVEQHPLVVCIRTRIALMLDGRKLSNGHKDSSKRVLEAKVVE